MQNPVKEPILQRKQVVETYTEKALKSKITIDNRVEVREKGKSRLEQMKVQKQENQVKERSPGYKEIG